MYTTRLSKILKKKKNRRKIKGRKRGFSGESKDSFQIVEETLPAAKKGCGERTEKMMMMEKRRFFFFVNK